jgi:hypothetical protein
MPVRFPCENDPRVGELLPNGTQQFHRSGVHAPNILCPFTASAPGGRPKLDRQTISNCYLNITLVNALENIAARFVCKELVGLEVANRAFEFINYPRLDSAISDCNVHRAIQSSRAASPLQTRGGPENCAS